MMYRIKENKNNVFMMFFIMLILGIIFVNSFYWPDAEQYKRKAIVAVLFVLGVFVLPVVTVNISFLNNWVTGVRKKICEAVSFVIHHVRQSIVCVLMYCLTIGLGYVIALMKDKVFLKCEFRVFDFYLITIGLMIVLTTFYFRKKIGSKPEILFVTIVLLVGSLFIAVLPTYPGISWDDEIHYNNCLTFSNLINGVTYKSDAVAIGEYGINIGNSTGLKQGTNEKYMESLNEMYENKELVPYTHGGKSWSMLAYIPGAIGIIIGRGLSLSYTHVYMLGKFFNLLLYAILMYYAIKKLKYGKILLATIGLLPTMIFMASSYAYDQWLLGFTAISFSYYISLFQEKNRKVKNSELAIIVIACVVGLLPKAIYFPLLFPLLFLPKDKYESEKQRKIFYGCIVLGGVFLLSTFLLPMLIGTAGSGDMRGGTDVNTGGQISYVLAGPIRYLRVLLRFLKDYLSVENSAGYIQLMAYLGQGEYWGICMVTMFVVAFTDRNGEKTSTIFAKIATFLAVLGVIVLVPTSLYLAFTGVGSDTIAGCQPRYIIPILFPTLYFLMGGEKIENGMNRTFFAIIPMYIMGYTMLYNLNLLFIQGYY